MNTRYFTSRLLALMLAALLVFSCAAAEETEIPSGVVDNFVQSEIEKQQSASDATAFEAGAAAGEYYADFTFGGVQTLSGITTTLSLYANLPKYAKPVSAVLRLSYTASDLILTDISSLTYYMNGTPFGSSKIVARSDGAQTVLYVSVPVELLTTGYNLLEILSYVRLTDDEGCRDDYNGANWVKIADTTCLRIYYEISDDADELYMYPYPFISLMNPDGAESVVAVSDAADETELTAAMMLMAGMGNSLSAENAMTLCRLSDAKSENVLYVGLKKNTPEYLLSLLTQSVPATGALVQRATDGDTSYLLIVAEEEAALSEAAALLSDTSRVAQLHTSQTYVSVGEAQQYALASETSGLTLAGQYTIKDISGNGISFSGPFTQKMTIYLPVAKDYVLSSESRFSFDIRYSENLDFDRSLVTFYWGTNIPLYSHKLTKEGATGETLTFSVPADAIGEAGSSITVVFDLEIKDLDCTVRSMNTPWAYIAANSSLYLPAGENTTLNLANLPAPFQRASRMNNVVMILSDDATQTELTLAGRIMAMLGAGSTPYGLLKVIRAENFQAAAHGNSNLIVVGLSDRNSVLKQINPYLHFQYTDDMTSLAESTKLVMTADYAHEASVLQLMKSPYNETMALLTASAATEAGLQNLMARLSTEKNRWSLGKEALVVDGYGGASSYQFTVSTALTQNAEKPSFADVIVQNREPMTLLLVGMGCMLVLLLAAVLLLVRIHHRRKYDDK